jgi:PPM family protein phosphatase
MSEPKSERALAWDSEGGGASGAPGRGATMTFAARTDVGRRRSRNEDRFLVIPSARLVAVADGMGGHPDGDMASDIAVRAISDFAADMADSESTVPSWPAHRSPEERFVLAATLLANRRVWWGAGGPERQERMGTTLVLAKFSRDFTRVAIANVGDSRCYRLRGGSIRCLTWDHVLTRSPADPNRKCNVLTRAVGPSDRLDVDVIRDAPRVGDTYLLCSDGLWGGFADDELHSIATASTSLDAACDALIAGANERGGFDNVTVALARIDAAVPPPTRSEVVPRSDRGGELLWDRDD